MSTFKVKTLTETILEATETKLSKEKLTGDYFQEYDEIIHENVFITPILALKLFLVETKVSDQYNNLRAQLNSLPKGSSKIGRLTEKTQSLYQLSDSLLQLRILLLTSEIASHGFIGRFDIIMLSNGMFSAIRKFDKNSFLEDNVTDDDYIYHDRASDKESNLSTKQCGKDTLH